MKDKTERERGKEKFFVLFFFKDIFLQLFGDSVLLREIPFQGTKADESEPEDKAQNQVMFTG